MIVSSNLASHDTLWAVLHMWTSVEVQTLCQLELCIQRSPSVIVCFIHARKSSQARWEDWVLKGSKMLQAL